MDSPQPRLALTVEYHRPARFHWILLESTGGGYDYMNLLEGSHNYASYREAFNAGLAALWKLAPELNSH